jgi:hypothetical protein
MPVASTWARSEHIWNRNANRVHRGTVRRFRTHQQLRHVRYAGRSRSVTSGAPPHRRQGASTCGDRGSRALASLENGLASVTSTAVANRAGVHHSAVRRNLSPSRVVETLANGLVADPLFCG